MNSFGIGNNVPVTVIR